MIKRIILPVICFMSVALLFIGCGPTDPESSNSDVSGTYIFNNGIENKLVLKNDMSCVLTATVSGYAPTVKNGTYTVETYASGNWVILTLTQNGQSINYDFKRVDNDLQEGNDLYVKQ